MAHKSQNAADVKYVEEAYGYGCYTEKNPKDCDFLAKWYHTIQKDFEKASKLFRLNCDDNGYGNSCYEFGNYLLQEKTKSDGGKQAYHYYEKGCKLDHPNSCLYAGLIITGRLQPPHVNDKIEVELNVPKGIEYMHKSCGMHNGNGMACFLLSNMYRSGVKKYNKPECKEFLIDKDEKKAFEFACKGCELRNLSACLDLSTMYAKGYGTEKNQEKSKRVSKLVIEIQSEKQSTHDWFPY